MGRIWGVVASLIIVMTMLSGCMDVRLDFFLNKDGSGGIHSFVASNQSLVGDGETVDMDTDLLEEIGIDEDHAQIERKPLEFYKDEMLFRGEENRVLFNHPLIAFNDISQEEELQWSYQGDGVYRFEIPLSELSSEVDGQKIGDMGVIFKAMGGQIIYSFETDYEVVGHNADYIKEKAIYVWDLTDDIFLQSSGREYGFMEIRIDVAPSNNLLRRALEEENDLDRAHKDFHGEILKALGYLKGTDKGLELNRELTRAEGAIMYSRLLDLEDEVIAFASERSDYVSGFTDVPSWARDTINYLHYKGLVRGLSDELYGSNAKMTEAQYTTLVLRALGYKDQEGDFLWNASTDKAIEIGLYDDDLREYVYIHDSKEDMEFTRRKMSYISYNALFFKNIKTGEILYKGN
ncbi:S-layer homology domain-containing protein [Petrocella sp. FN5]|uniref:S-layer homology domain-containing protein n=1 Tax=Petrocella sp. FN5 TaxID=3032002 RepID=UPI0023DB608B|nr:S-layer homology domain-containing protein [Petrocella sp. FN5]MDF1616053.1 S-layer homology domain-containing protein [Petrocella sp. FN5]